MFNLYWFNSRDGMGYPTIEYPQAMTFEQAQAIKLF